MSFAPVSSDFSYWQKQDQPLFTDLLWNIPEQKSGTINIIGGNSAGFNTTIRLAEHLMASFPISSVKVFLPDSLRHKLPPLPNLNFLPSTDTGSIAKSPELTSMAFSADFTILAGDLSKNSATAIALDDAITKNASTPFLITRDAIDLLAESASHFLSRSDAFLLATMPQLQKIFRAVYYPKMIMLSSPLLPVVEALHKFTISYPCTIATLHEGQIIVASSGQVTTTPLANTDFTPISLWSGQLAGYIAALNLYNPGHPLAATTAALLYHP